MQKRDPLSLRPNARLFVDQLHPRRAAARQHRVEIVDREADVMDSRSALRHEASYRGSGVVSLQQLYHWFARAESDYGRAVGVIQRDLWQPQHVPEKWKALGEGLDSDSNVGYASATRG